MEEVIVVGICPNERMTEYTLPGYEDYGRFLVETLKPMVDAKYRTLSGPTDTAVMGSSLGGVVSFYLGWQWPDVFGKGRMLFEHVCLPGRSARARLR
jgi:enterochelin esterase-like enzyme